MLDCLVFRGPGKHVYLTFDDGPHPEFTPRLLGLLRRFRIKATFFVVGRRAVAHPEILDEMHADGHAVGNHSFNHISMVWRPRQELLDEIARTDDAIAGCIGYKPSLFRPPYGRFGRNLLRTLATTGHSMVLWNFSTRDYRPGACPHSIQTRLAQGSQPGNIILLHDGHRNSGRTLQALANFLNQHPNMTRLSFATLSKELSPGTEENRARIDRV